MTCRILPGSRPVVQRNSGPLIANAHVQDHARTAHAKRPGIEFLYLRVRSELPMYLQLASGIGTVACIDNLPTLFQFEYSTAHLTRLQRQACAYPILRRVEARSWVMVRPEK